MIALNRPIRTVFDCNIFLQAMANRSGPAGAVLDAVRAGTSLCLSARLFSQSLQMLLPVPRLFGKCDFRLPRS